MVAVINLDAMYPGMRRQEPKTAEDLHRMCAWCNTMNQNATDCYCLRDCGKPLCARSVEEFQMPETPRFG